MAPSWAPGPMHSPRVTGDRRSAIRQEQNHDANRQQHQAKQTSLMVAVRLQPMLKRNREDILREVDGRMVIVLDPDQSKSYLDEVQGRTKEKKYTFDRVFGKHCTNTDVFKGTVEPILVDVVNGISTTVIAYGATGSGKTHTMVGTLQDPGMMVLALDKVFWELEQRLDYHAEVTCSYLEVYNELIYDLLVPRSTPLDVREDPHGGIKVAGLRALKVTNASDMTRLLEEGNRRRKTEPTSANATSSRSHAVLEISVTQTARNQVHSQQVSSKLTMVDLAGSERAADTGNMGQKMRDGANINRSLLALANCINALGKAAGGRSLAYIPFRDSKLTRLLKDGLVGNSRALMVATVSSLAEGYHTTVNTLKYADRAKEIKTRVHANVSDVETHIAEYQRIITGLQQEVSALKRELSAKEEKVERMNTDEEAWEHMQALLEQMSQNAEELVNLQRAMFEVEEQNNHNRWEAAQLDRALSERAFGSEEERRRLQGRHREVLEAIEANDGSRRLMGEDTQANDHARHRLQQQLDEDAMLAARSGRGSKETLFLALQQRMASAQLIELQFQMAVRDQLIAEQRAALAVAAHVMECVGLRKEHVLQMSQERGVAGVDNMLAMMERAVLESPSEGNFSGEVAMEQYAFWSTHGPAVDRPPTVCAGDPKRLRKHSNIQ
eukprot:CAMPEP_0118942516 /NCGR_PEP_ID=MMETSP1169-20130426/36328_1 /TAXON_ID=36882 /ORGANISM="Pyramimonas obovata, Strain CCMP722" /LENGTH=667 /DNA_ID=CAMNT_0006887545 /DNA_START=398 /DNA_END=2398 /DNA_ORIENTATION=-